MKKRGLALFCVAAMAVSSLAGCGGGSAEGEAQAVQGSEADSSEGGLKDTITFAKGTDVTSLDPHIGKQLAAFSVTCNMFEQLVALDDNMEPQPSLAESWEQINDLEWRFNLRKDVTWHNGEPFTADDVKFSYERMQAMASVANNIAFLDTVTVEDEHTVILKTKYPYSSLLAGISTPPCSIVPKSVVEADEDGFALNPIGTGPYKFVEWKPDESVTMEAYDGYWGEPAKTQYLVMKVVPEATQRSIMLETGEIDVAYDIAPNDVARLEETEGLSVLIGDSMKISNLHFNCSSDGPIGDKRVRQAIAYAIDRQGIVDGVLSGIGQAGILPVSKSAVGFDDTIEPIPYDPEQAKALLAEAGYPDGFECTLWVDDDQVYTEVATVIQSMLQEVGITMNIETMKQATKQDRLVNHQDFDLNMSFQNNIVGDADYSLYSNLTADSASNFSYYVNPEVEELILKERSTFDEEDRQAIFHDIYTIIMDELPIYNLYDEQICVGVSDKVQGLTLNKIGAHKYQNVTVSN